MNQSDYLKYDAVGLAELVAKREVSPDELLKVATERMAEVNPKLNAVILDLTAQARGAIDAGLPDGPFRGVPYLIKDLGTQMRGVQTRGGSAIWREAPPAAADSALIAAYRAAGLVMFGKTNTPEFGLQPVTEPTEFGPTRNPWNLERTPGGSSGGSSAAVAAGIVPAAQASDGGGSIRIPASCAGLVGLKPSRGRVSMAPVGEGWGGMSTIHAVSRSLRDSAALLDISCRPQPGDPYFLSPPERPYLEEVGRDPGKLRIAYTRGALLTGAPETEVSFAVDAAARLLASLGHDVEEVPLPFAFGATSAAGGVCVSTATGVYIDAESERRGRPVEEGEVEPLTWRLYQQGKGYTSGDFARAVAAIHRFGRSLGEFMQGYDVLMTSTLGRPPIRIGELSSTSDDTAEYYRVFSAFMPNTQAFNHSGQPAISLPLAWTDDGLPVGIQFAAATGDEAVLFRLAGQLEKAQPWWDKRPAI
jgi:amidase